MIYYLPLEIKGRGFHIAALHEHQPQIAPVIKQYVLENKNINTKLFSLDNDTRFIAAQGGFSQDLYWSTVAIDFDENTNLLTFNLTTVSGKEPPLPTRPNVVSNNAPKVVHTTFTNGNLEIALHAHWLGALEVVLQASMLGTKVSSKLRLHIAPVRAIWDVALDFGSEASQLSKRPANGGHAQRIPMIQGFKLFYTDKATASSKDFLQHDKEGFFRSIFFAHSSSDAVLNTTDAPNTQNELIPMLNDWTKQGTFRFHTMLPTIKLAALGVQNTKTLQLKDGFYTLGDLSKKIYRKLIFNFLHTACNSIKNGRDIYLRFKLLIPNVFKQVDITNLVQSVEKYADLFKNQFPIYGLKGIEISTVSESDAAFAGYMLTPNLRLRNNGKYAIIDAGRGTTDYSIVEILSPTEGVSLYRSGFIGAGAMLTFAFIDTVIKTILVDHLDKALTPHQRLTFFLEKICGKGVELIWQLEFLALIEALKARHEQGIQNPASDPLIPNQANILNTPLNILNGLLKEFVDKKTDYFIQDKFGFIKATTDALANRIFDDFQKLPVEFSKLDGIILSGRGFLFEPLRDALRQKFATITTNVEFSAQPKGICMDGAFTSSRFNGNCNMEGMPYAISFLTNQQQQLAPPPPLPEIQQSALSKLLKWFQAFVNSKDEDAAPVQQRKNYYQDIHKFLKGGSRQIVNSGDRICISGHVYEHHLKFNKSEVNLFFTGADFLVRTQNDTKPLTDTSSLSNNDAFTKKTLFPTILDTNLPLG
jgi:hypothetical protein